MSRGLQLVTEGSPKILNVYDKHGDYYYIVNSEEDLSNVSCAILKNRLDDGYYETMVSKEERTNNIGFSSLESIEALPDGRVKKSALIMWEHYQRLLKHYQDDEDLINSISEVLEYKFNPEDSSNVRNRAYYILVNRSGHEYEALSLKTPDTIPEEVMK